MGSSTRDRSWSYSQASYSLAPSMLPLSHSFHIVCVVSSHGWHVSDNGTFLPLQILLQWMHSLGSVPPSLPVVWVTSGQHRSHPLRVLTAQEEGTWVLLWNRVWSRRKLTVCSHRVAKKLHSFFPDVEILINLQVKSFSLISLSEGPQSWVTRTLGI